jgi:hypothetical protein
LATAVLSLIVLLGSVCGAEAALGTLEQSCTKKLALSSGRLNSKAIKLTSKCRDLDIAHKKIASCPDANAIAKINKQSTKLSRTVDRFCGSRCSDTSSLSCLADSFCPPAGATAETCGVAGTSFDIANLGFPGAFCESIIGGPISTHAELATCVDTLSRDSADTFIELVYGSLVAESDLAGADVTCLEAIGKASVKLITTIVKGVGKCRDGISKGRVLGDPSRCTVDDAKLAKKIEKADQKLRSTISNKCPTNMSPLDLCGNGVGGTATIGSAQECLSDALGELADFALLPVDRNYTTFSIIEAAFPPRPMCGDDVVNQGPTSALPLGEECDGGDMGSCTGSCAPPGDAFQCTCDDTPRAKLFVDYFGNTGTDTDAGWTGLSHNQKLAHQTAYTTTLENCNCAGFTDATCTGGSSDPVCDANGAQLPTCLWDPGSATRCDDHGDSNGIDQDADCWRCDSSAVNAGATCTSGLDCQSQCYDGGGMVSGPCSSQADCAAADETCRGRCDKTPVCRMTFDGGPLAVNTAGTAVCTVQVYKEPITGTRNIVTGEHELNYQVVARVHLAESNFRPCPVCGGFCVGGKNDLHVCQGRCSVSDDPCRFDSDCPGGESCLEASPDCPGGVCELSLVCGAIETENPGLTGTPCSIDYTDPLYGSLSNDCPPAAGKNISGSGLEVDFMPSTHAAMTTIYDTPCTAPGFELLDCPCPSDGGAPTQPNSCAPACDAGPDFGIACGVGNTSGLGTSCAGGTNAGLLCDEDTDCPGSSCSANPTHCKGDPTFYRNVCATNGDCGVGTCEDACPGGKCLPLCVPDPSDPEDGLCADGPPAYHCEGELFQYLACSEAAANGSCNATCSSSGDPCLSINDCSLNETCDGLCAVTQYCEAGNDGNMGTLDDQEGAGSCIPDERSCFLNPIPSEGGSTLNGKGDHTNWFSVGVYCFRSSVSAVINDGAGFGGPGRTRRKGANVVNVTSIP